ncbi:2-oxoglutarate ferredoxin oxidoreductase subunit delta [Anaerovirgula multivorans]|uniref:2-oxoglutarate ferredoxin oxidoreductase subunit delta n=1 Tax=Anaerovirgula multivorans TaxID=312168 RepID=A0A238ZYK6_9FIRM|nr:4Fe-4S binding protein [Anaerovirgula multivorans]SNR88400.1 2-oxoglutarate ferredoxin oxidoreductase subunit delta [Anaerovirgula multivorans]
MANEKVNKELKTVKEWCKGCNICVEFCPVKILELKDDKIHITDKEKCIKCGLCELRCPDYAIYLEVDNNEK